MGFAGRRRARSGGGGAARRLLHLRHPHADGRGTRPSAWAMTDIDVNGEDIGNVSLTLAEGMTVTGKIQFAGKARRRLM